MNPTQSATLEFERIVGGKTGLLTRPPLDPGLRERRLRLSLIAEEFLEFAEECGCADRDLENARRFVNVMLVRMKDKPIKSLPNAMKELADLEYTVAYAYNAFQVDGAPVFEAVHQSNLAKKGGGQNEFGKYLKPRHWQPPNIWAVLEAQGWEP